ncbi:MAG: LacI family transcriptional regulator [Verrucomicrobiales bacterium]|nr:LacI family transcriptional regulator [Verrucomicrobiales bacterium]
MQDVADKAGVSRAAVSLALRNHPSLPIETRSRIQFLADQLGYRPNPLVSALMTYQRTVKTVQPTGMTIAFVSKFSHREAWRSYLSPDLISGAAESAERQGYHLDEFWMGDLGMTNERFWKMIYQRGIRGMIIAPLPSAHGHLSFNWPHFSAVAIGYTMVRPILHRVSTDRYQAMLLAVRHLRRLGYRRLGLALDINQNSRVDHQWAAAFQWEQQRVAPSQRTEIFLTKNGDWTAETFSKWYTKNRPEVILGYDPIILQWLKLSGKRVPEDLGFVHLWIPDQYGQYAGLYHAPPAIGAAAVDFLIGLLQRNECGIPNRPQTVLLNATWVDGASLIQR